MQGEIKNIRYGSYINLNIPVSVPNGYPLETLKKQVAEYVKSLVTKARPAKEDLGVFDSISGAWDDGISVEEETNRIRAAMTSGFTRHIGEF